MIWDKMDICDDLRSLERAGMVRGVGEVDFLIWNSRTY
jgi:hypothetical protein